MIISTLSHKTESVNYKYIKFLFLRQLHFSMKIIKILLNPRVASALVSAVSAVICATFAGCKLTCGRMAIEDFEATIFNQFNSTNSVQEVR